MGGKRRLAIGSRLVDGEFCGLWGMFVIRSEPDLAPNHGLLRFSP